MYFKKQLYRKRKGRRNKKNLNYENNTVPVSKSNFSLNFTLLFFVSLFIYYIITNLNYFTLSILNFDFSELISLIFANKDDLITFSITSTTRELSTSNFNCNGTFLKILKILGL